MAERQLIVRIVGDDKALQSAFTRSEKRAKQFGGRMDQLNQGARGFLSGAGGRSSLLFGSTAFLSTAGLTAALSKSIDAASDLNEQIDRTRVVLGASADEMIEWSETTAQAMGISQRAALAASGTFSGLFQTVGLDAQRAGELSRSLVQLAADLASLQNSSPEEALTALRSGLVGESEPLRRFNIFLSEARVGQQAMADTGKENVRQLTNAEKALARYNIILRDSVLAQGNFRDTAGGLANQTRILRANLDDLSADVGGLVVPALTDLARTANLAAIGLGKIGDVDVPGGSNVKNLLGWVSGWKELHFLLDQINPQLEETVSIIERLSGAVFKATADLAGAFAQAPVTRTAQGNEIIGRIERQAAAQSDLNLQLANSEKRAAHLRDLIREDPTNAKLQQRLTAELTKQATLRGQIAQNAKAAAQAEEDAARAARDHTIALIDTRAAQALLTKGLQDDLIVAKDREATLRRMHNLNKSDLDIARQLNAATQERRDLEREIAQNRQAARRGRQFRALGLTTEGQERIPGVGALRRRLGTLREQVAGTVLDTPKTQAQLNRIAQVLSGKFGKVGRDVRAAILQMFADIFGAFDQGSKQGPLTASSGLNTKKVLEGLGLSPEQVRELRGRLSSVNTAGRVLGSGTRTTGGGAARGAFIIENHLTVSIDGREISARVTKEQQKAKRRNPQQKRGPNRRK